jgi:hypothetical protein
MDSIEPQGSTTQAAEHKPEKKPVKPPEKGPIQRALETLDAAGCEYWRTPNGDVFATVLVPDVVPADQLTLNRHKEHCALDSQHFEDYLVRQCCYDVHRYRKVLTKKEISCVLAVLRVKAQLGPICTVYRRCAFDEIRNTIYIDLGTDNWEYIEVTAEEWHKVNDVPVKFVRSSQMGSLPGPVLDTRFTIQQYLKVLLNIQNEDEIALVAGFMLFALMGKGPFPILCFYGGPGTGKSTACEAVKRLIDPGSPRTKMLPHKDEEQFMVIAENSHCLAFDNISVIKQWQSDALCRIATGAGLGVRQHYKHKDEVVYDARKPIVLAGIEEFVERSDLADRAITIELPLLPSNTRITETEYRRRFEKLARKIFGTLLEGLVCGLRRMSEVRIDELPRMADFAVFVTAAEPALGLESGAFLKAYQRNVSRNSSVALESSSVVPVIVELVETFGAWEGTATGLLTRLNEMAGSRYLKAPWDWPTMPNRLSGLLKRVAPNLERAGIEVRMGRNSRGSSISLRLQL